MTPYTLLLGDCIEQMRTLPDASVDAVVTDPPYELGFMGKSWDASGIAFNVDVWREALRVLKPGGHLLAFSGSRTYHRMAVAIEDAGFEVRDQIMWIYGSGFPKSLDVSKAIDKALGAEREVVGSRKVIPGVAFDTAGPSELPITEPATAAAAAAAGWGTALKPAHEPCVLARKPLIGTVAANVLAHGTGALNIDGCRIGFASDADERESKEKNRHSDFGTEAGGNAVYGDFTMVAPRNYDAAGRWPANVMHDGSDEVVELFPSDVSGRVGMKQHASGTARIYGTYTRSEASTGLEGLPDSGSAARFFYTPKADASDRNEGLDGFTVRSAGSVTDREEGSAGLNSPRAGAGRTNGARNFHPTVKPTDLMRYLCRLVTPTGGVVLDPFMGSGSTGKAALLEGFRFIGIERDPDYMEIARARIAHVYDAPTEDALFSPSGNIARAAQPTLEDGAA